MLNLRVLAEQLRGEQQSPLIAEVEEAMRAAELNADSLDSLIDGDDDDDLGRALVPIRDFLRQLAGAPSPV